LPLEEKYEASDVAQKYGVDIISLIAPTSEGRIKDIAKSASGFIYVVSSMGTTGVRKEITTDLDGILRAIKENTDVPAAIGFGISTPEQAKKYSQIADGVIVGSALVKIIAEHGKDSSPYIYEYVKSMKDAIR
jgi:tryptophan synthase alpha chain